MKRKFLSILLVFCMALSFLPTTALADASEGETESGGENSNNTAQLIYTIDNETTTEGYPTIADAVQAADNSNMQFGIVMTIKLLANVTGDVTGSSGKSLSTHTLILDLNGYNYTGAITKDHDLTIKDSTEGANGKAHLNYVQCNVLTLESGTVTIDDASIDHTTKLTGANVTINGGEYRIRNTYTKAIDKGDSAGGTLIVNGGIFNTRDSLNSDENEIIQCTVKRQVNVNEGIVDVNCYVIGKKAEGDRTIKKTSFDNSSTLYFYDLSTAALVAVDGDTIELLGDQTISKKVEIKASVTLDGNGHKIALAERIKNLQVGPLQYGQGVFEVSGGSKNAEIRNLVFENIDRQTVMIRAYSDCSSNSTLTVDKCTFDRVNAINVVRAASSTAAKCKLVVTNSVFKNCTASLNGIIQIDSHNSNNVVSNAVSEITGNSFINNSIGAADNVAVIYLSAPAKVENNYFENNTTKAKAESSKNGIIVTGSNAKVSTIKENAFVSHTFTDGKGKGAIYGAAGTTTVNTNYYADGINHLVEATNVTEGASAECYKKNETTGVTAYENHSYSTAWNSDANDHWHTCLNCDSVTDKAAHVWNNGSVTTQPTTTTTGVKTYTCTTCNATKTETIAKLPSDSGSSSDPTYAVSTPSKTEHGTVTVSPRYAERGDTVTITVKPDSGYVLETLTVTDKNGNELTLKDKGNGKYTFTMPAGKVEVKASFAKEVETSPFTDVATDDYYYEAVKWAVKNGITTGVGNDLFAPGQPCTRAQIVTFLWRAAGSPEPKGTAAGMTDVVSGSYYEKAVAWAIENGITTGTTATTFSPDATCTRAQAVTFLARALNAKAAGKAEFSDVPADSYFANAVAWAAANGVTEGVGNGLFAPDNNCTRGQIVTFLYRAYNK